MVYSSMLFPKPPADFVKGVDVVGCYMEHEGRIALLRRLPGKSNGDKWGLPAGKVEPGEDLTAAMAREIREETGISVDSAALVPHETFYVQHADRQFVYHTFSISLDSKPDIVLHPDEHHEYRWATPAEALTLPLVVDQDECIRIRYGL